MPLKVHPSEVPLLPPNHELNYAGIHWVERMSYDGVGCGLEIYQWQPIVKKWCLINDYATGRDLELKGYRYVANCPFPPDEDEVKSARTILTLLKGKIPPGLNADYQAFKRAMDLRFFGRR